jgi:hypothetical protein
MDIRYLRIQRHNPVPSVCKTDLACLEIQIEYDFNSRIKPVHMGRQMIIRPGRKPHSVERLRPHVLILISPIAFINQLHW